MVLSHLRYLYTSGILTLLVYCHTHFCSPLTFSRSFSFPTHFCSQSQLYFPQISGPRTLLFPLMGLLILFISLLFPHTTLPLGLQVPLHSYSSHTFSPLTFLFTLYGSLTLVVPSLFYFPTILVPLHIHYPSPLVPSHFCSLHTCGPHTFLLPHTSAPPHSCFSYPSGHWILIPSHFLFPQTSALLTVQVPSHFHSPHTYGPLRFSPSHFSRTFPSHFLLLLCCLLHNLPRHLTGTPLYFILHTSLPHFCSPTHLFFPCYALFTFLLTPASSYLSFYTFLLPHSPPHTSSLLRL